MQRRPVKCWSCRGVVATAATDTGLLAPTINQVTTLPLTHRVAHRLARAGLRGSSWTWRVARLIQRPPPLGVVRLPDGTPLIHDPSDWTCRTAYEGTYEREILRLLVDLLDTGDIVVDVGANVGIITVRSASLVGPTGRVIAVEPSPRCIGPLTEVVSGLDHVTVIPAALGDQAGTLELAGWDNPDHRGLASAVPGHRAGLADNWHEGASIQVEQMRLDRLLTDEVGDDTEIALLKIDVEGFEPAVLRGAPGLLASRRVRSVILEVTTTLPVDWAGELLHATACNYDAFAIEETGTIRRRLVLSPVDSDSATARTAQWNLLLRRR